MSKGPATLRWFNTGATWLAGTSDAPRLANPAAHRRAVEAWGLEIVRRRPFAVVRPERDAGGNPSLSTGRWLAILDAGRARPGVTSFDMTTTHASLDDALLHIEALAALDGIEIAPR